VIGYWSQRIRDPRSNSDNPALRTRRRLRAGVMRPEGFTQGAPGDTREGRPRETLGHS
jgi:hypothetical protein